MENCHQISISEYNKKLVDNDIDVNIIDYVKNLNEQFYNIDITFIDDFNNLVDKDEACIPQEYLFKYGVLSNTDRSYNIRRLLDQYDLQDLRPCGCSTLSSETRTDLKTEFLVHPLLFKLILIRAKNTIVFASLEDFILVEIFFIFKLIDSMGLKII